MVRRYDEHVEVRGPAQGEDEEQGPTAFLWHDRLYVVREVLGHWRERRAWWRDAAGEDLLGLSASGPASGAASDATSDAAAGRVATLSRSTERQVWRVEASAGRTAPSGVYDLSTDDGADWRLLRVAD